MQTMLDRSELEPDLCKADFALRPDRSSLFKVPRDIRRRTIPPFCFATSEFSGARGPAKRSFQ
jgi:hypothetical protein